MASGRVNVSKNGELASVPKSALDSEQERVCRQRKIVAGDRLVMDTDEVADELPPQKRRKFSPIVWDKEDCSSASLSKGFGQGTANISVSCVGVLNKPCGKVEPEVNDSPVGMSSSLTYQTSSSGDQEPGQMDEEDLSHAPNIMTSRWASDDDLHDEDLQDVEEKKMKSRGTPESGSRSSGSTDGYVLDASSGSGSGVENEDFVETGEVNDEKSCETDMESDDIPELGISEERTRYMFQECRSVFDYEKLGKISEGSYGIVFRARDKKTGDLVALKKLKMGKEREGFPLYYLREINNMLSFDHPSVLGVKEVVVDDSDHDGFGNVYMVMEYMEHDLKALMESRKQPFSQSEVKCLMLQLLEGVKYLHDNWVLHRDLKTSNLLLNNQGDLKICDFGMARQYGSPLKPYTSLVVTLWYRAPELLLGAKEYSTSVDMWSVGCIMGELLAGKPLFDGRTEVDQLNKIIRTLGTPNEKIWPGYSQLPGAKVNFVYQPYSMLPKKFPRTSFTGSPVLSDLGLDLLSKLLTYDPEKRITAEEALNHAWFHEVPLPKSKEFMPTFPASISRMR